MAIPSGTGTEVLRNGRWDTQSTDVTSFDFTGGNPTLGDETDTVAANHIITMININWAEISGTAELINLYGTFDSKAIYIMLLQGLPAYGVFNWNTKFVLIGGDTLFTGTDGGADIDVHYSYLDQDWS